MNRIEYYAKLDRYHLEHASTKGTTRDEHNYFMRIGEPGKYRYFYSKAEWDAYQEGEARNKYEANKKKIENNSNLKLYNVTTEQRNTYNKNRDAANNSEADRWTKVKTDNIKKEATEKAKAEASSNFKLSPEDLLKLKAQNLEDNKYMTNEQSAQVKKELHEAEQKKNYEKNKAASENSEADRWAAQKKQREHKEAITRAKKETAERKRKAENQAAWDERMSDIKQNIAKRKAKRKADEKTRQEQEAIKEEQARMEEEKKQREMAEKVVTKEEEYHRQKDRESKDAMESRRNIINNFRDKSLEEIEKSGKKLHQELADVLAGKLTEFDESNPLYERLEEKLKKIDPNYADYKKSLKEYLEPTDLKVTTKYYKDRFDKAEEALNQVAEDLKKEIADTKFNDIEQGKTYLQKENDKYIEAKNKKVSEDIIKAKNELEKVYEGDSNTFKLDPALMKVLNSKIWEIDDDYDGDLVDYIEPNLFGKFWKEDTAYNMVKDILDEMEQELNEDKVNKRYTEYINEIKKSL